MTALRAVADIPRLVDLAASNQRVVVVALLIGAFTGPEGY
jgi:hypothetical protein